MPWKADTEAYLLYYSLYSLVFYREKVFYTFIFTWEQNKINL